MELFAILVFALCGASMYVRISRFVRDQRSPLQSVHARVKEKIFDTKVDDSGAILEVLKIVFDVDGQEIMVSVPRTVYKEIPEMANGVLTHKGSRFKEFCYDDVVISR